MINVVIVEDEQAIRRFLRTALEAEGLRVYEAETLQRGLIETATRKPDLVSWIWVYRTVTGSILSATCVNGVRSR